jgi:Tfp pilus assembly protein PilX
MTMKPNNTPTRNRQGSRGVALITALLLLSLFTVMTLAMVIATSSDLLIDGYYRNLRGSFYAADSGLNAARQYLAIQLGHNVTGNYQPYSTSPPIAVGAEDTVISGLGNSSTGFGGTQSILSSSGAQASSWPGTFTISYISSCRTSGAPVSGVACPTYMKTPDPVTGCAINYTPAADPAYPNVPTCTSPGDSHYTVHYYTYSYPYKITAVGNSTANQQNTVEETGLLVANVALTTSAVTSFAAYGTLFDRYSICSGGFVKGTMSGRFFSNDSWNFGDSAYGSGSYIFTGNVGAHNPNVGYMYGDGTCDQSSASSDSHNGTTIAPTFQSGLSLNQAAIPLPQDSFNQLQAVLDGRGGCPPAPASCPAPSAAAMSGALKSAADVAYPSSAPSSGVYLPYSDTLPNPVPATCSAAPCFTGGGIYVQGNADQITMSTATVSVAGSPHSEQVFVIKQGATTTTVTLDLTGNQTTISDNAGGGHSKVINDLPRNLNASGSNEAAMLYVNGNISGSSSGNTTGLSGPSSGAAIQDNSAVTVTATGTIAITGDIKYTTEPVTLNAADTLVTSPSTPTNVLGIFTTTGDIQLRPPTDVSSMEVDASLAMISQGGSGGLIAQWNQIGTLTIVGGRIASQAKSGASIGSGGRNIWFDQRFSHGFAPPWFPSTTVTSTPTTQTTVTPSRISWTNTTAM